MTHRVVVLVRDGVLPLELGIVHRIFGDAKSASGASLYETLTCTDTPGRVRTDADFQITVQHGPELLETADTVVVPASTLDYAAQPPSSEVLMALARIRPETRIASICTGSFLLAAAGLLDGRRATTHWNSCDRFRAMYPRIHLDPDVLYTDDSGVLTSAGAASGIDLCLHMVRKDYGAAVANEVARKSVVPPHRSGGQAQYIRRSMPTSAASSTGRAREWASANLDRPISLREWADRESMSIRTFTRRFRDEMGTSPNRWLIQQRVERACVLLEETELSIDEVAAAAGFGTPASFRLHLQSQLGVSPTDYRRTFRFRFSHTR